MLPLIFFANVYQLFFRSQLRELAVDISANHVVQSLITFAGTAPVVSMIAQELVPHLTEVMQQGFTKVVICLLNACAKFKVYEKEAFKIIGKQLIPEFPVGHKQLAPLLLELQGKGRGGTEKFAGNGCLLLIALLNFSQNVVKPLLDSLFDLPKPYLVEHAKCWRLHWTGPYHWRQSRP